MWVTGTQVRGPSSVSQAQWHGVAGTHTMHSNLRFGPPKCRLNLLRHNTCPFLLVFKYENKIPFFVI